MRVIYETEVWTVDCGCVECGRVEQDPWNDEQSTTEFERESSRHYIVKRESLSCGTKDIIDEK
jgi:hypothetical protein